MLCQVGVLEMRGRREWCVMSGGRARDKMEREGGSGVLCQMGELDMRWREIVMYYVRWKCFK